MNSSNALCIWNYIIFAAHGSKGNLTKEYMQEHIKKAQDNPAPFAIKRLLLRVKERVERLDELVGIDAMNQAGLGDGLGRGVRAVQAMHAIGHEDRSNFRVELHDGSDGHISSDHEKDLLSEKLDASVMIHHFSHSGKRQCMGGRI